jgi:tRNA-splicing ligase RtcB
VSKPIRWQDLIKISDYCYEIPQSFRDDMRVSARAFMTQEMFKDVSGDRSLEQLVNVATLPGIQKAAFAMPDMHQGYGFPIGGVAAMAIDEGGVISPGGIGYDINCGVRLLVADATYGEVKPYLEQIATEVFNAVPSGVGRGGKLKLDMHELDEVLRYGAKHMVKKGFGTQEDLDHCEEGGCFDIANPDMITQRAKQRGADQLGTLGSGNHFLEIQKVDEIYDEEAAQAFGLRKGLLTVMIHCGSRGLGHQTCTDYVRIMNNAMPKWGYQLPDRELVCAPFLSQEAQDYYYAMAAAANFAWANRHMIAVWTREAFNRVVTNVNLTTVYDVSHNIGKVETHTIDGKEKRVIMHRKGATRSFGPGNSEIPAAYRDIGQPVLIPGTMGTSSYVLAGTKEGMNVAFGSCCHGAGRRLSRTAAKKMVRGPALRKELENHNIIIRCDSDKGLAEEAPIAYKDVDSVVNVVQNAKIARKVARLLPVAVIKGG